MASKQPPDLDSILATLRALTDNSGQAQHTSAQYASDGAASGPQSGQLNQPDDHEESHYVPPDVPGPPQHQVSSDPRSRFNHSRRPESNRSASSSTVTSRADTDKTDMDATLIIDWQKGLRHVTKLAAKNEQLGRSIQKMIRNQRENEKQWWAGREALIEKQKSRGENNAKLNEVLRNVVPTASQINVAIVDERAELQRYDLKVWRCQEQMVRAFSKNLRELGVPFFETNASLVKPDKTTSPDSKEEGESSRSAPPQISAKELRLLQLKMIQYLEDMYGD